MANRAGDSYIVPFNKLQIWSSSKNNYFMQWFIATPELLLARVRTRAATKKISYLLGLVHRTCSQCGSVSLPGPDRVGFWWLTQSRPFTWTSGTHSYMCKPRRPAGPHSYMWMIKSNFSGGPHVNIFDPQSRHMDFLVQDNTRGSQKDMLANQMVPHV